MKAQRRRLESLTISYRHHKICQFFQLGFDVLLHLRNILNFLKDFILAEVHVYISRSPCIY